MAENKVRRNQSTLDFDPDIPAAEVLIDLKESARRRRALQKLRTSPRRRKAFSEGVSDSPKKTPNHRSSSRRLDFSNDSAGLLNSVTESSEEGEEVEEETVLPQRKSRRLLKTASAAATAEDQGVLHSSPSKQRPDQVILHTVSSRLRNLLKLLKAHKWCYYEWFYSDIDQPLLEGENDFCRCLSEMFPELKTRRLVRVQWQQLRRLMGKPRRCSPTFFQEERALLEYRRNKVRNVQQQVHQGVITVTDFTQYKDIPDEIPALLVVGTEVTARLHTEREKGFFTGRIEAMDIENHRYWVAFDRPGLGKHAILDTEIRSAHPPEVISVSALEAAQKTQWPPTRDHHHLPPRTPPRPIVPDTPAMHALLSPDSHTDPFLTSSPARRKMLTEPPIVHVPSVTQLHVQMPDHVGGFPVDFLKQVTQLSKLLQLKQQRVQRLTDMNTEVEKQHARQNPVPGDYQKQYATVIIDLDDINKQLNMRLDAIRSHCNALGYGAEIRPSDMGVQEHAQKITESANTSLEASGSEVKDPRLLELVSGLTGILLQVEKLAKIEIVIDKLHMEGHIDKWCKANCDPHLFKALDKQLSESANSMEMSSLTRSVEEIQARIHPENRRCFRDNVETPVTLIQSGMNPVGTLHAFSIGSIPRTTAIQPNL